MDKFAATGVPGTQNVNVEQLYAWGRDHLWMQGERAYDLQEAGEYKIIVYGEGCYIYDIEGNRYLDCTSSGFVKAIGHNRPEIARAIASQLAQLSYTPSSFG